MSGHEQLLTHTTQHSSNYKLKECTELYDRQIGSLACIWHFSIFTLVCTPASGMATDAFTMEMLRTCAIWITQITNISGKIMNYFICHKIKKTCHILYF